MYEYQYGEFVCGYLGGLRLYLGIEAVSCRLLPRTVRVHMDWILKKSCAIFFFFFLSFNAMPGKKHQKSIMFIAIVKSFDVSFLTLQDQIVAV